MFIIQAPNSHSASSIKAGRYMGLDLMFDPQSLHYFVIDVNGKSYFAQTPAELKRTMRSHGRSVLKRKAYQPRRMEYSADLRQVW